MKPLNIYPLINESTPTYMTSFLVANALNNVRSIWRQHRQKKHWKAALPEYDADSSVKYREATDIINVILTPQ